MPLVQKYVVPPAKEDEGKLKQSEVDVEKEREERKKLLSALPRFSQN